MRHIRMPSLVTQHPNNNLSKPHSWVEYSLLLNLKFGNGFPRSLIRYFVTIYQVTICYNLNNNVNNYYFKSLIYF